MREIPKGSGLGGDADERARDIAGGRLQSE